MVRFSQSLDDKQSKNREKPYEQHKDNHHYYSHEERQPHVVHMPIEENAPRETINPNYQRQIYQNQEFYRGRAGSISDRIGIWSSTDAVYSRDKDIETVTSPDNQGIVFCFCVYPFAGVLDILFNRIFQCYAIHLWQGNGIFCDSGH